MIFSKDLNVVFNSVKFDDSLKSVTVVNIKAVDHGADQRYQLKNYKGYHKRNQENITPFIIRNNRLVLFFHATTLQANVFLNP